MATDDDLRALLADIRAELVRTREVQQQTANRALEEWRKEMLAQRRIMRLMLDQATSALQRDVHTTISAVQLGFAQTLDVIARERLSLTRFGDGELQVLVDPGHHLRFQRNSAELRRDLAGALNPRGDAAGRVLVALPHLFRGDLHWIGVWIAVWDGLKPHIDPRGRYGNAHVSRPVFFAEQGQAGVAQWRSLWQGREVLIVTGRNSRFDLLPALFDGAGRIDFIYTLAENAYDERARILDQVLARAGRDTLVLLSLGPTATILVPQIAAAGVQALDIGHIANSYQNVFATGAMPEHLPTSTPAPR